MASPSDPEEKSADGLVAGPGLKRKGSKKADVSLQTEKARTQGSIWNMLLKPDVEAVMQKIHEDWTVLDEEGAVGENPIHMLFLYNTHQHLELAKQIIDLYPTVAKQSYGGDVYAGETALHIAIVHHDEQMVKFLLNRCPELLTMRATGAFFSRGEPCYFGELPLGFAACVNSQRIVALLLAAGASLEMTDSHGNNLLHLCVWHKLKKMYKFIAELDAKRVQKLQAAGGLAPDAPQLVPLSQRLNNEGLTPLCLAATLGDVETFDFVFSHSSVTQWKYGPVSCLVYPLWEVDTLRIPSGDGKLQGPAPTQDASQPERRSALEIAVAHGHLDILTLPRMVDLLHKKWTHYAQRLFYRRCLYSLVFAVVFTLTVVLRPKAYEVWRAVLGGGILPMLGFTDTPVVVASDSQDDPDSLTAGVLPTGMDWLQCLLELFVVIGAMFKARVELDELRSQGKGYFQQHGAAFIENSLASSFIICLLVTIALRICGNSYHILFEAVAVLLVWTYVFSLLLAFRLTGPMVLMVWRMVIKDIGPWLLVYSVLLLGFASLFYTLEAGAGVWVFLDRIHKLFMVALGDIDFEEFSSEMQPGFEPLSNLFLLLHVILVTIMLLNLLIAMMGDTYAEIAENVKAEWHTVYAQTIMSVEAELSPEQLREDPSLKYWTTIDQRPFLQVIDVDDQWVHQLEHADERAKSMLAKLDFDGDGQISLAELERAAALGLDLSAAEEDLHGLPESSEHLGPQDKLPGRLEI